jgi:hypothetical protein
VCDPCVTARRANHFSSRATSSPALARKIFRFAFAPNQPYNISHPALTRGAYRDRHGRRVRGAVAAAARARKRFSQGGLNACERGPRADERDGCGRQSRVVLAPVAGVKPAEVLRNPTGFCKAFNPPVTEAKGIRLRGEHGISRKTTAQGMPACSGCTCMLVCASLALFAHETAGAASTRHSLRPLLWAKRFCKPRACKPREGGGVSFGVSVVIASEAKQSISPRKEGMDCFVASLLAMTWIGQGAATLTPTASPISPPRSHRSARRCSGCRYALAKTRRR